MLLERSNLIHSPTVASQGEDAGDVARVRPIVSVIIVNYNTRELTLKCLRAVDAELAGIEAEIWLVDNASSDDAVTAIANEMPHVRIIANQRNAGFGGANNQAMARANGEFFLLLNSDAFVCPGAVRTLLDLMQSETKIGAAGPRLVNADDSLQVSCFRFPSPGYAWGENLCLSRLFAAGRGLGDYRRWTHDCRRDVDWVVGACMIVRREVYESVGGFDERFFMYAEETDWQRRIRAAGWRIHFTPDAEVVHLGQGSAPASGSAREEDFFDSLDRYELKHHGVLGLLSLRLAIVVGSAMRGSLWAALGVCRPSRRRDAYTKARFHWRLLARQATHIPSRRRRGRTP